MRPFNLFCTHRVVRNGTLSIGNDAYCTWQPMESPGITSLTFPRSSTCRRVAVSKASGIVPVRWLLEAPNCTEGGAGRFSNKLWLYSSCQVPPKWVWHLLCRTGLLT